VVERYRTRFLFVEIPTRVYQSLRRAVRRRCNLYGAVRDTPAPDWPWPWRRAANHGRGDGGVQSARATTAGGRDVCDHDGRARAVPESLSRNGISGGGGSRRRRRRRRKVVGGRRAGETAPSLSLSLSAAAVAAATAAAPPPRTSSIRPVNDIPMI